MRYVQEVFLCSELIYKNGQDFIDMNDELIKVIKQEQDWPAGA